jgi:hypothetical protein
MRPESQPKAIALEAWKNVEVHVERFLSRRITVGQEKVDALDLQARPSNTGRELLCHSKQVLPYVRIELR